MLVEKIKEAINYFNNNLQTPLHHFEYGKEHWQNLADHLKDDELLFEQRNKYFKLLWVDEEPIFNQYYAIDKIRYEGELLILCSSKISDPSYDYKYETHIKNIKSVAYRLLEIITDCNDVEIIRWKLIEVENVYDNNLDGVKVSFNLKI